MRAASFTLPLGDVTRWLVVAEDDGAVRIETATSRCIFTMVHGRYEAGRIVGARPSPYGWRERYRLPDGELPHVVAAAERALARGAA